MLRCRGPADTTAAHSLHWHEGTQNDVLVLLCLRRRNTQNAEAAVALVQVRAELPMFGRKARLCLEPRRDGEFEALLRARLDIPQQR